MSVQLSEGRDTRIKRREDRLQDKDKETGREGQVMRNKNRDRNRDDRDKRQEGNKERNETTFVRVIEFLPQGNRLR